MQWKKITDTEGLPSDENERVLAHYHNGLMIMTTVDIVRRSIALSTLTHWCIPEPPKPMTDGEACEIQFKLYAQEDIRCNTTSYHRGWHAALAWERSKKL